MKYRITTEQLITVYYEIEAKSKEEAIEGLKREEAFIDQEVIGEEQVREVSIIVNE